MTVTKAILDVLRPRYPEEFLRFSALDNEDVDLLIVEGTKDANKGEIAVKRILIDNELVRELKTEPMSFVKANRSPDLKLKVKKNAGSFKTLFNSAEKREFLVKQFEGHEEELVNLTLNSLVLFEKKHKALAAILAFACSSEFLTSEGVKTALKARNVDLNLTLLPLLFTREDVEKKRLEVMSESWLFRENGEDDFWLKPVLAGRKSGVNTSKDSSTLNDEIVDKISKVVDIQQLVDITSKVSSSEAHVTPVLATFAMSMLRSIVTKGRKKPAEVMAKSTECLMQLMKLVRDKMEEQKKKEDNDEQEDSEKKTKEKDDLALVVLKAKALQMIPNGLMQALASEIVDKVPRPRRWFDRGIPNNWPFVRVVNRFEHRRTDSIQPAVEAVGHC